MLPPPARYFPIRGGRYDVAPALRPLGTSFGNGEVDRHVFQLDDRFDGYRANKIACRGASPGKHRYSATLEPPAAAHVAAYLIDQLTTEHPQWFAREQHSRGTRLQCRLTGETLHFDADLQLTGVDGGGEYADALDALCGQIQEDLAIVRTEPGRGDWLAAYHICAPSHWAPEEKAGRSFVAIHEPVPGIEPITRVADAMVDAMVNRGPFVRFVWGIDTDRRYNRHPLPPEGEDAAGWPSPPFDPSQPSPFVFRVERQVMVGLPEVRAALFLIRLYLTEGTEVRADPKQRHDLGTALAGMSPESRAYKGITSYADRLSDWLDGG
jgi:hypothetical protein